MEEDIKILENLLSFREQNPEVRDYEYKAIENLITIYKELEEDLNNWKFTAKYVEDNYIDKGKIISKINKLQNSEILEDYIAIPYLQELLEES